MNLMVSFMSGVLVIGYAIAGLFFLRFWKDSGEASPLLYVVRLVAFTLIIVAFVEKNRADSGNHGSPT